jgi:hypothetical protein
VVVMGRILTLIMGVIFVLAWRFGPAVISAALDRKNNRGYGDNCGYEDD